MNLTLFPPPYSRAATMVWMLEELGLPYQLEYVDLRAGAQKEEAHLQRNRMGKLPVLVVDGTPISETAAIGLYLVDRYALGRLSPALDHPSRGAYLRWALYGPSVVEPGCAAHSSKWETRPSSVGWGRYEDTPASSSSPSAPPTGRALGPRRSASPPAPPSTGACGTAARRGSAPGRTRGVNAVSRARHRSSQRASRGSTPGVGNPQAFGQSSSTTGPQSPAAIAASGGP